MDAAIFLTAVTSNDTAANAAAGGVTPVTMTSATQNGTAIDLVWVSPHDTDPCYDYLYIWRKDSVGNTYAQIDFLGSGTADACSLGYQDVGPLTSGRTYTYKVKGNFAGTDSAFSNEVSTLYT